jgi:hypothetical protein
MYRLPHPEEPRTWRCISKHGRESVRCGHPSRRRAKSAAPHATTAKPLREDEVRRWILTPSRDSSVASIGNELGGRASGRGFGTTAETIQLQRRADHVEIAGSQLRMGLQQHL